jgi:hypothetical protein
MKKGIPIILLVLVGAGFWLLVKGGPGEREDLSTPSRSPLSDASGGYRKAPDATSLISNLYGGRVEAEAAEAFVDGATPAPAGDGIMIPDEYVFRFHTRGDQEAFMKIARELGFIVLGRMSFGNALRVRVPSADDLRQLLEQGPAPKDYDHNYFVRAPDPERAPQRSAEQGYAGLGDSLLAWLGPNVDNSEWGRGVTIAVLDTAVSPHPGIPENRIRRIHRSGMSTEGARGDHGTVVSSLIVGDPAYAAGIAPAAKVLSIPIMSGAGTGDTFTLAQGILDAVSMSADIINMSLGTYGNSALLRDAIRHALLNQVAVVAATGNDAQNHVSYPARYAGVIGVGAVDANGRPVYFSNQGSQVDLAAPGYGVQAAGRDGAILQATGTSISTPLVSGALAAVMSQSSGLRPLEAAQLLLDFSDDRGIPGRDAAVGRGVISVARVLHREDSGIYDMTAAPAYVVAGSSDDDLPTVYLYAQNRGTEPLRTVTLSIDVGGSQEVFTYDDVAVGNTVSHAIKLTSNLVSVAGAIDFKHVVKILGATDTFPGNNSRQSIMTFKGPSP